jgi:hypothetical protein
MIINLPSLVESNVSSYLSSNLSLSSYPVFKSFDVQDFAIPAIVVNAAQFTETEPMTNVFEGELNVLVISQIDEVTDILETHDNAVSGVYTLLQADALNTAFNSSTHGHMWGSYLKTFEQMKEDRSLISKLTYSIHCQSLSIE